MAQPVTLLREHLGYFTAKSQEKVRFSHKIDLLFGAIVFFL